MDTAKQIRVLIVDDDVDTARTLARLLRNLNFAVEAVVEAAKAISRLVDFAPDMVLLDIAMPRVSGYELAKAIRQQPGYEALPLIAVSGYGDERHALQARTAGFDHLLVKPVPITTLLETMSGSLERSLRQWHEPD